LLVLSAFCKAVSLVFSFNLLLSLINISNTVMPGRSIFFTGWALN